MKFIKQTIAERRRALAIVMLLGVLSACNTMEGVGRDVEAAGDSLEDAADENNEYEHHNH